MADTGVTNITSTSSTALPDWLKPYALQFLKAYSGLAFPGGDLAQMPAGMNQTVAPMRPNQQLGLNMMQWATAPAQDLANAGVDQLRGTLAGDYLHPETNPYLKATYEAAAEPMTAAYQYATAPGTMAAAQRSGQMGGSAYTELAALDRYNLGRNLSELATDIYGGNYERERARQSGAQAFIPQSMASLYSPASNLLGVGAYRQEQGQLQRDVNFANALRRAEYPFAVLSGFGGALGQAGQGTGSSTSTYALPNSLLKPTPLPTAPVAESSSGLPPWLLPAIAGAGAALPTITGGGK